MWCHIIKTHMRTLVVIEFDGFMHCFSYFGYRMEFDISEQFIFLSVVYALGDCIVLRVTTFRHANLDSRIKQQRCVRGTDILHTSV